MIDLAEQGLVPREVLDGFSDAVSHLLECSTGDPAEPSTYSFPEGALGVGRLLRVLVHGIVTEADEATAAHALKTARHVLVDAPSQPHRTEPTITVTRRTAEIRSEPAHLAHWLRVRLTTANGAPTSRGTHTHLRTTLRGERFIAGDLWTNRDSTIGADPIRGVADAALNSPEMIGSEDDLYAGLVVASLVTAVLKSA